jgi:hypothetical protein
VISTPQPDGQIPHSPFLISLSPTFAPHWKNITLIIFSPIFCYVSINPNFL